jgi:hypothetical protein
MDHKSIFVFRLLKELSAKAKDIDTVFVQVLGSDAITCMTAAKYMRNDLLLQNGPQTEDRTKDQGFSITDNAILEALEMIPFASIRQIAKVTFIPHTTGFGRLTKSFHFVLKRLRSAPHRVSDFQKHVQIIM